MDYTQSEEVEDGMPMSGARTWSAGEWVGSKRPRLRSMKSKLLGTSHIMAKKQTLKPKEATIGFLLCSFRNFCHHKYENKRDCSADGLRNRFMPRPPKVLEDIHWTEKGDSIEEAREACIEALKFRVHKDDIKWTELTEKAYKLLEQVKDDTPPAETESMIDKVHQLVNEPLPETSFYYNYVRIKNGYFFLVAGALSFSVFSGILTETLVAAFTDTFRSAEPLKPGTLSDPWKLFVVLIPFMMMLFATMVEHLYTLALDAIDVPPFTRFQATMLAVFHADPTKAPEKIACQIVDVGMFLFEAWPFCVGIWGIIFHRNAADGRGLFGAFMQSFVWGGIGACGVASVVYLCAHVYLHGSTFGGLDEEDRDKAGDGHEAIMVYQKALDKQKIFPVSPFAGWRRCLLPWQKSGIARLHPVCFQPHLVQEKATSIDDVRMLAVDSLSTSAKIQLATTTVAWIILCILLALNVIVKDGRFGVGVALVIVVFTCSYHFVHKLPDIAGAACLGVLCAYVIVMVALVTASLNALDIDSDNGTATMVMSWNVSTTDVLNGDLPWYWSPPTGHEYHEYSLCHRRWGSVDAPLTALDLGQLALFAYENKTHIPELLDQAFNEKPEGKNARVKLQDANDLDELPRWVIFDVPALPMSGTTVDDVHRPRATKVLAIKGTSTKEDVFADVVLFSAIRVLQFFQEYVPVLSVVPINQIQWVMQWFHAPGQIERETKLFNEIEEKLNQLEKEEGNPSIVLTGHSLGGGLAQAISAHRGVKSLVWSAPGFEFSSRRFRFQNRGYDEPLSQEAQRVIDMVMPKNDLVPQVDRQGGTVHTIECRNRTTGNQAGAALCHRMEKTICEVWRVCGDVYNRSFAKACGKYVKSSQLGAFYKTDDVVADAFPN